MPAIYFPTSSIKAHSLQGFQFAVSHMNLMDVLYIYINNRSSPKCEGLLWRMFPSKDVLHSKQSQSEPSRGGYFECETQNCSFSNSGQDCIKTLEASSPLLFYVQWSFLSSVGGYVPSAHECLKPWMIPNPLCVVSLQRHTCDNLIN